MLTLKVPSVQQLESKPISRAPNSGRVATTQLSGLGTHVQPQPLVGPRPMKKYTGNGESLLSRNPTDLTPSAIDRFHLPISKSHPALNDTPRFTSSNPSLVSGRHSPVYVAVPVDRPPVKVKPKARASAHDTLDISTINELRNKLLHVNDSGTLVTYALQNQREEQAGPSSSGSERDNTSSPRKKKHESSGVTMATGVIPWEDDSIHSVGFVTGNHGRKSQSPVVSSGIVQIGKGLGEEGTISGGDSKRSNTRHKAAISPPRNSEPGAAPSTISLTFQFNSGVSPREQNTSPPQRPPTFPPQLKNFFRPHGPPNR